MRRNRYKQIRKQRVPRGYWYRYIHHVCPECGVERIYKKRIFGSDKPADDSQRHEYREEYDYCNGTTEPEKRSKPIETFFPI